MQAFSSNQSGKRVLGSALTLGLLFAVGCRQDMHNQPKFYPQRGTTFFADGRSVRPQVAETVARGQLHEDNYFFTGLNGSAEGTTMPFPVTMQVMARGQEKYNVFCTPCHSRVGNGVGMIVQRGYAQAGNFHTARLEAAPLGHFFNVITHGYGAMPNYASQLTPEDRWAVVAYVKALQLSQNAQQKDVAAGAHVESLSEISEREGFPAGFAAEWALPPTAVTGTPDGQPYVLAPDSIGAAGANAAQFPAQGALGSRSIPSGAVNSITQPGSGTQTSTGYSLMPPNPGPKGSEN